MPIVLLYASCSFALAYASKELLIFLLNVAQVVIASRSSFVRICATVDGSELRKFRVVGGVVQVRAIFRRCFVDLCIVFRDDNSLCFLRYFSRFI